MSDHDKMPQCDATTPRVTHVAGRKKASQSVDLYKSSDLERTLEMLTPSSSISGKSLLYVTFRHKWPFK